MLNLVPHLDSLRLRAALAAFALAIAMAPHQASAQSAAVRIASGLASPIYAAAPAGDDRVFIVERAGTIKVLQNGSVLGTNFLDITDRVIVPSQSEAGLLSLVFDPNYAANGAFYVFYVGDANAGAGVTPEIRVARFVAADPASSAPVDKATEAILFRLTHPASNHFGGTVAVRGGYLYVALGDGGGGGDPNDQSQNDALSFGKMLRFDLAQQNVPWTPEVWAKGFRNPFRFSFDRSTGDLYVGDVGQETLEEVDVEPAASTGGRNYGWDVMEGTSCYADPDGGPDPGEPACNDPSLVLPVYEYTHENGNCAITGGAVYRGNASPALRGLYFFIDSCAGRLTTLRWNATTGLAEDVTDRNDEFLPDAGGPTLGSVVAIAEDGAGELYAVSLYKGSVFKLVPEPNGLLLGATSLATLACVARRRRALQ